MQLLVRESMIAMLKVFVVADHEVVREGLASVLGAEADLEIVADGFGDGLPGELLTVAPDVVVIDHAPPHGDAIHLCRILREADADTRIVVLVDEPNGDSVEAAMRAGARICLAKDVPSDRIVQAVRVAASEAPDAVARANGGNHAVPMLAQSHLAVLRMLVEDKSVAQIAEAMGLSHHTVRSYLRQIYQRLGVRSKAEATAVAVRLRLI